MKQFTLKKRHIQQIPKYSSPRDPIQVISLSHVRLFATPWTVTCQAPLSMGIHQTRILDWVAMGPSRDLPNPGIKPKSPTLQADSLPSEPPGKPKITGVGSLSLLQGNFLTQELNQGFLHCRRMLYQLSLPYFLLCIPTFSLLNSYFVVIFLIN